MRMRAYVVPQLFTIGRFMMCSKTKLVTTRSTAIFLRIYGLRILYCASYQAHGTPGCVFVIT